MKAACLTGIRDMQVCELPEPKLTDPHSVLLRIEAVGVCGSDVHFYTTGRIGSMVVQYPYVVGHECAGTIIETGSAVNQLSKGQRVAVDPLVNCGRCDQCLGGRVNTCRNQRFLGCPGQASGALTEHLSLPAACCYSIPDHMTMEQAVATEPLAIGLHAARLAEPRPGAKIAVLGSGPIGLCVLLASLAEGSPTAYVTDLIDARLAVARRCGANWTGNPNQRDIVAEILAQEPLGMDFVFECAGVQETVDQGIDLLKPGGTMLLIGIPEVERISFIIEKMRRKELRVQNVRRQNECVIPAINHVADGSINVNPLITHHFPLGETKKAFDLVADYRDGVVKAIVHVAA